MAKLVHSHPDSNYRETRLTGDFKPLPRMVLTGSVICLEVASNENVPQSVTDRIRDRLWEGLAASDLKGLDEAENLTDLLPEKWRGELPMAGGDSLISIASGIVDVIIEMRTEGVEAETAANVTTETIYQVAEATRRDYADLFQDVVFFLGSREPALSNQLDSQLTATLAES